MAKGKSTRSPMCHSAFSQLHNELFLGSGSSSPRGPGSVSSVLCASACQARADGCIQLPHNGSLKCIYISHKALVTFRPVFEFSV